MQLITSDLRFVYKKEVLPLLEGRLVHINFVFKEDTLNYVGRLISEFDKIYRAYFPHELNHNLRRQSYKNESLKSFFSFLKEFELFPKLVTAGETYFIYNEALSNPRADCLAEQQGSRNEELEQGSERPKCFSLGKFVSCLIVIGKNCYSKLRQGTRNVTQFPAAARKPMRTRRKRSRQCWRTSR